MKSLKAAWKANPEDVIMTGAITAIAVGTLITSFAYLANSSGVLINALKK